MHLTRSMPFESRRYFARYSFFCVFCGLLRSRVLDGRYAPLANGVALAHIKSLSAQNILLQASTSPGSACMPRNSQGTGTLQRAFQQGGDKVEFYRQTHTGLQWIHAGEATFHNSATAAVKNSIDRYVSPWDQHVTHYQDGIVFVEAAAL